MFRRTFWFTAGAAAGVWATTKVHRKLKRLTPESLAAQAADKAVDAGHRVREFALDVRAGMLQREAELGDALGLRGPGGGALPPPRRAALDAPRPPGTPDEPKYLGHPMRSDMYSHKDNRNEDH
ncbi:DUF6167 family protein [Streptomyces sp. JNUCC 64]